MDSRHLLQRVLRELPPREPRSACLSVCLCELGYEPEHPQPSVPVACPCVEQLSEVDEDA